MTWPRRRWWAIVSGQERTFHQDPAFALRLLADPGLRALSSAVNDPATAVQVLDAWKGCSSGSPPPPWTPGP
ncbi:MULTISPECIES: DUF2254 family protein [unclassified Kitasatospora]|uniref:DUF2254 family protein n=1 Tax=unclassified Kitasatospora TaxID=2633591 RepID=UPI0024750612|nr:DUF2254 family protein [Kitasatospora sp. MAP12-44]